MARKVELVSGGKKLLVMVPQNWNELTGQQLVSCTKYLFSIQNKDLLHLQLLRIIMPVPKSIFNQLEPWQLVELRPLTAFMLETPALTRQLLPAIRIGNSKFHGPKEKFRNLQLLEFIFADTFFLQWHTKQDPEILDKLIAVLYRPAKPFLVFRKRLNNYDGDPRQQFNQEFVAARSLRIRKLQPEVKFAILTWYRSCRLWLESKFPHVFSNENQGKAKKAGSWEPVLRNMAGPKFGDIYKTGTASLLTILQEMDDTIAAAEEFERKNKRD